MFARAPKKGQHKVDFLICGAELVRAWRSSDGGAVKSEYFGDIQRVTWPRMHRHVEQLKY
jgi:hypothetical protein